MNLAARYTTTRALVALSGVQIPNKLCSLVKYLKSLSTLIHGKTSKKRMKVKRARIRSAARKVRLRKRVRAQKLMPKRKNIFRATNLFFKKISASNSLERRYQLFLFTISTKTRLSALQHLDFQVDTTHKNLSLTNTQKVSFLQQWRCLSSN